MAPGIPHPLSEIHNKFVIGYPYRERLVAALYRSYLKIYIKLVMLKQHRTYSAPLKPLKLLWIDPDQIKYSISSSSFDNWLIPKIEEGDWHREKREFSENLVYKAVKSHYERGMNWEETDLYNHRKEKNQRPKKRIGKIEELYHKISDEGYKTQKELKDFSRSTSHPDSINHLLREFNEVTVSIGPEGEFYFNVGQHRLAIAKVLQLDEIPVRVLLRHKDWQEKREIAVKNPDKLAVEFKQHPDLKYLINQN